ncbi:MAG: DUF7504 family protein [Thermoplasmatota archaeon]
MSPLSVRLAKLDGDLQQAIAARIQSEQEQGRDVVFVTTNLPARSLRPLLEGGGAQAERLHVVDAITPRAKAEELNQTTFVGSPTMLELIGMRAERVARHVGQAHIMVCCLNTLRMYNDANDVDRFMHYLASRVQSFDLSIEFIVRPGPDAEELADRAQRLLEPLAKT